MRRKIVMPADVSGSALAELKDWLGISRPNEDDLLTGLLQSSLEMCEAFTGLAPLSQQVEERLPAQAGRYRLASQPVETILSVEALAQNSTRSPLAPEQFEISFEAAGCAVINFFADTEGQAIVITLSSGLASEWSALPPAIRQGIIRLSAHMFRDRDRQGNAGNGATPPASVTALWRPWRTVRLT